MCRNIPRSPSGNDRRHLGLERIPTNAPHPSGQKRKNARIPHVLGTPRAANMVVKPHQSLTYPGVGEGGRGLL